jgi:3-hydroxy-9,10-secoandrosta-1,3,5(10)-triene-9,17-dione monooxygenase reductase component
MTLRTVEPSHYRAVIGRFATGVCVVTVEGPEGPVGMTANAVCSVSLDPLLLLVCFDAGARTLGVVRESRRFGVNVLTDDQKPLAALFASKLPETEKFAGVPHRLHDGVPVIEGVLAWLGCDLTELVPAGDHVIGIGAVDVAEAGDGEPLVWYRGAYGAFAPTTSPQP